MCLVRSVCTLGSIAIVLAGCTPAAVVVGGGSLLGLNHTLHCYGIGMVNNCPTPIPAEIIAARNNDVESLKKLIAEQPKLVKDPDRLDPILGAAAASDATDVVRLLVPVYAEVERELSKPGGTMLSNAVSSGGCKTVVHLLDLGAIPRMSRYYDGEPLRHLVWASTIRSKSDACLGAAKRLIDVGYKPSSKELSAGLSLALGDGWEGKEISNQWNVPNYEMTSYLRSLGAIYLPPPSR